LLATGCSINRCRESTVRPPGSTAHQQAVPPENAQWCQISPASGPGNDTDARRPHLVKAVSTHSRWLTG
jgi:hypothetical protein